MTTAANNDVAIELAKTLKLKPKKDEPRQEYLGRLVEAAENNIPDAKWDELSEATQQWINDATVAARGNKEIPDFESGDEGAGAEAAGDDNEGDKMSTNGTGKKTAAKKTAAKKTDNKKTAAAKPDVPKKTAKPAGAPSMRRTLKQMIVKKPRTTLEDLAAKLAEKGFKPTPVSVSSIRSDTLDTMKVLKEAGLLEIDL